MLPDGWNKKELIYALLGKDRVKPDLFPEVPHKYAHHLNSSQMVCYEFFRPLITAITVNGEKAGKVKDPLVRCLNAMGLPGEEFTKGKVAFEYEPDPEEKTNFDFYVESGDNKKKVYFEIKYTEGKFGSCEEDGNHEAKFNKIYKPMIDKCVCLKRPVEFGKEWCNNYQLFRNVLRATNENEYVVFLFPEENETVRRQYEQFRETFLKRDCNVKAVHWEDLSWPGLQLTSDAFREKYFFYAKPT